MLALWMQKVQLPTKAQRQAEATKTTADKFRERFRAHNVAFEAAKRSRRDKKTDTR